MDEVVQITGLRKVFKGKPPVTAIDGLDLRVQRGQIYGLLGPNGAGKTTTISIATTRTLATTGRVLIGDIDVAAQPSLARRRMGVVPQYNTLDRACTVAENIRFHCVYFGMSWAESGARTATLLEQFRLSDRAKAYPQQLSGGLAQRVQIARAIAHRPEVLFLDEPSAGLDPQSRLAMWNAVTSLREQGITVVLTTHYMEEADELCDRVAIMDHGRILVEDTPAALKAGLGGDKVIELRLADSADRIALTARLLEVSGVEKVEDASKGGLRVLARGESGMVPRVIGAAEGFDVLDVTTSEASLETVFIRLTGRELRE